MQSNNNRIFAAKIRIKGKNRLNLPFPLFAKKDLIHLTHFDVRRSNIALLILQAILQSNLFLLSQH